LISDTIAQNHDRYGELLDSKKNPYVTSNAVEIRMQWNTLGLQQYGNDTRWIDRLFRLHYLQRTGVKTLDKFLGIFGLLLLIVITFTGVRLLLR
jgi:hypothetical protein